MSDEDRTFADSGAEAFVKPETPKLAPEKFDFSAWLDGITPVRRSVTVYGDGHAQAEIDELARREATLPAGEERGHVRARLTELTQQIADSAVIFVIEGRTQDWVSQQVEALKRDKVPDDIAGLHITAAQIVSPEGVTADGLHRIAQINEPAVNEIMRAAIDANTRPIGLDPRFLPSASV